jgi:RNA polymerase sigma factor (sigma-70 family)
MATMHLSEFLQQFRRAAVRRDGAGLTDVQLLESFLAHRDEAALAALVRRHGPMVWSVCRRLLDNLHDAEDAFQATFLVLVRKAATIQPREMLVNWLYGVASQTARKARAVLARRRQREKQVAALPEPAAPVVEGWFDLRPLLDRELERLPDKCRAAVLLCDLEGVTRKEAARRLGVHEEALSGRLTRGRSLLASRLARRGVALSVGALTAVLAQQAAAAAPAGLAAAAVQAALPTAAFGMISPTVACLTEEVLKTMALSKLKWATALLAGAALVLSLAAPVSSTFARPGRALAAPIKGAVDADKPKEAKENTNKLILDHKAKLTLTASSFYDGWPVERLIDGKKETSWFSTDNDSVAKGSKPWVQIEFPGDVKVSRVSVFGNREEPFEKNYSVLSGTMEFLDKDGKALWSEELKGAGDNYDFEFTPKKPVDKVRFVKFTSASDEGDKNDYGDVALGEIQIE